MRGTSRREEGLAAIEAAGIEPALADPERPGTMLELVGDVAVLVLCSAAPTASAEELAAIHGPRLERLMERLVDTPVRGFVYEAAERRSGRARGGRGDRARRGADLAHPGRGPGDRTERSGYVGGDGWSRRALLAPAGEPI